MVSARIGGGLRGALALVGLGAAMIQAFQPPLVQLNRGQPTVRPVIQPTRPSPLFSAPSHRGFWARPSAPSAFRLGRVCAGREGALAEGTKGWKNQMGSALAHLRRTTTVLALPALLAYVLRPARAMASMAVGVKGQGGVLAMFDNRMSMGMHTFAAVLGRFVIPAVLFLYFWVNIERQAKEEAKRVKRALDQQEKNKQDYIEEMKKQGINLGGVGGTLSKEEEDMLKRVEKGSGLSVSEKTNWVNLLKRAQYSRDVVDGKMNANPEVAIMSKKEIKRVSAANKRVKEQGFKPDE